jgi:hypothetical protein
MYNELFITDAEVDILFCSSTFVTALIRSNRAYSVSRAKYEKRLSEIAQQIQQSKDIWQGKTNSGTLS